MQFAQFVRAGLASAKRLAMFNGVSDIAEAFASLDIVTPLGRGGMADVYLTALPGPMGFRKLVVVKKIRTSLQDDPEFEAMFQGEARLAARMSHPNVVQTLAFGRDADRYSIVMEFIDGKSMHEVGIRARPLGGMPRDMQLEVLLQMLAGLHYAHELRDYDGSPLGIVHRDVSPSNVIITYSGIAKLVDFGVAKAFEGISMAEPSTPCGKLTYMAPEQVRAEDVDARADVFATGVMLWEALTGRRLWGGLSEESIVSRLRLGEIASPRSVVPEVDEDLEAVCMTALAFRPENRFDSAAEFGTALETVLDRIGKRVPEAEIGTYVERLFHDDRELLNERLVVYQRRNLSSQAVLPVATLPESVDSLRTPETVPPEARKRRHSPLGRTGMLLVVAAIVGSLVVGLAYQSGRDQTEPSTPIVSSAALPLSAEPSAPPPPPVGSTDMHLTVSASPSHATLMVDGLAVDGNPYEALAPRDGSVHEVIARASGYRSARATVSFDGDQRVVLVLERIPPRGSRGLPSPPASTSAAPPATTRSSPPVGTVRFDDPWVP